MLIILLGAPGTGKGTQAGLLAKEYDLKILSTGEILRNAVKEKTKLGIQVSEVINSGAFVPDNIIYPLVESELKKKGYNGYILDGFPRTIHQAHILDNIIIHNDAEELYIISLNLEEKEIVKRLSSRIFCKGCNQSYNCTTKDTKTGKCDICGCTRFYTRKDDESNAIKVRLSVYAAQTSLLTKYYKEYEHYVDIDASQDVETIYKAIISFIGDTKS